MISNAIAKRLRVGSVAMLTYSIPFLKCLLGRKVFCGRKAQRFAKPFRVEI